jgi:hypothetical protein
MAKQMCFRGDEMTKDEALRLALEALEYHTEQTRLIPYTIAAIVKIKKVLLQQEAKDERVQVSPLQFVEMVMEKEDCVGKPIIWAEWPNKENT